MIRIKSCLPGIVSLKGRLEILNDSVITIGGNTILVDYIKKITVRNTATYITGGAVSALDLASTIIGIWGITRLTPLDPDPYVAFMVAIGLISAISSATGGILYTVIGVLILINGRSYKTSGRNA